MSPIQHTIDLLRARSGKIGTWQLIDTLEAQVAGLERDLGAARDAVGAALFLAEREQRRAEAAEKERDEVLETLAAIEEGL